MNAFGFAFLLVVVGLMVSSMLVLYVYIGYPLVVHVKGMLLPRRHLKDEIEIPVSFVITAFNEERDIREKLENTLSLDYPNELLEIIVASDCSDDRTDDIVAEFAGRGVTLIRQVQRLGKTAAQNLAVERAAGEIVVFSDATSHYMADAVRELVANFADPHVGCVAGKLVYVDPKDSATGAGAKSYWGYETFLKQGESRACSLIGVSGCIYAVRRANYRPMYPEACSDFLIATLIYKQGLRTVYEPKAVCVERTNLKTGDELNMRIRVISQTFTDLWRNREMLNPFCGGFYAIELISHKVLRYLVPFFLTAIFISSAILALGSGLFLSIFAVQAIFVATAAAGWLLEKIGFAAGPLSIPLYFVLTNVASVAGLFQFLRGERYASWEPIREGR